MNPDEIKSSAKLVNIDELMKIKDALEKYKSIEVVDDPEFAKVVITDLKKHIENVIKNAPGLKTMLVPNIEICDSWLKNLNTKEK